MAKVLRYDIHDVHSAPAHPDYLAELVEGTFVSIDSDGFLIPADYRNAVYGRPPVRGVLTMGAQFHDQRGNVVGGQTRLPYTTRARLSGTNLYPGSTYYLCSGGTFTDSFVGSGGDLQQSVGFAESETVLVVRIGDEVIAS